MSTSYIIAFPQREQCVGHKQSIESLCNWKKNFFKLLFFLLYKYSILLIV